MPCASFAQLDVRRLRILKPLVDEPAGGLRLQLERLGRQLQRDDRVHHPLLCAVVQIANDAPALPVGRRHDPRPRRRNPRWDTRSVPPGMPSFIAFHCERPEWQALGACSPPEAAASDDRGIIQPRRSRTGGSPSRGTGRYEARASGPG
jgi:hypothetical protein